MPQPLNVAAIVPAEMPTVALVDHELHRIDPQWMLQRLESKFLRTLHIAEYISAFERIALRADGAMNLDEVRAYGTVLCGNPVRVAGHFRRLTQLACYSLGSFEGSEGHSGFSKANRWFGKRSFCAESTVTALAHSGSTEAPLMI